MCPPYRYLISSVVVYDKQTSLIYVVSGVPQGTILCPLLFLLHISEFSIYMYRNIKNKQDQITLQKDLNLLEKWGNTWGMRFNAAKCNIM